MRRSSEVVAGQSKTALPHPSPLAAEAPPDPWRLRLLIFLGYLAVGVGWTWPMPLALGSAAIQRGPVTVDSGQGVWNIWWALTALGRGANPYQTAYLFYPLPVSLFYQTLSLPNSLLAAPAAWLGGPVAAFNLIVLISFALGGYWAYRLARAAGAGRAGALLGGLLMVVSAYHMQRIYSAMIDLVALQWIPLYILLLMRALARPRPLAILAAGAALLVMTLSDQYYGLFCAIYTLAHVALACLGLSPREALARLGAAAGLGVIWLAGLLPFLWPLGTLAAAELEDWPMRQGYHSLALVDLVAPGNLHPIWGAAAAVWHGALHPFGLEAGGSPGYAAYLLAAVAVALRPRRAWPWLALAALCTVLALGPELHVTDASTGIPLPFLLLDALGPIRNASRPANFVAVMLVPWAALAALGLDSLIARARRPAAWRLVAISLAALLIFEHLVAPWRLTPLRATPGIQALNADPTPGAVLELPPRNDDGQYLLDRICHGRPLVGGYLARLPAYPLAIYPSALKGLWDAAPPAPDMLDLDPAAELAALGIRYVTLDLTQLPRAQAARLRARLDVPGASRVYADERLEAYVIAPAAARTVVALGPGWYDVESDGARHWRWMRGSAGLSLIAPAEGMAELRLSATAYAEGRPLKIWSGGQLLASIDIPAAPYDRTLSLQLLLPPGQTDLTLESPAVLSPEGRIISLSISQLRVAQLPAAAGYTTQAAPSPPPTIPAIGAPPCGVTPLVCSSVGSPPASAAL